MICAGILLYILAIGVHYVTGLSSTTGPTTPIPTPAPIPDTLDFHCKSTATDVDIIIDTKLASPNTICVEGNNCTGGIVQPTGSNVPRLKSCPKDSPITIVITKSSERNICGGDGAVYFKLYCLTGSNMGTVVGHSVAVRATVRARVNARPTPLPKEEYEVVNLDMAFYKDDHLGVLDNTVTIGMTVYVLITSPNIIELQVENCTAYGHIQSENLLLLDSSGEYTRANKDGVLLEKFSNSSATPGCNGETCFLSKLHAFHFTNSSEVSLECYIDVCSDAATCITSRRRRRGSNSDRHVLRASMLVYDDLHGKDIERRSSGQAIGFSFCLTTTLAVLLAFIGYV